MYSVRLTQILQMRNRHETDAEYRKDMKKQRKTKSAYGIGLSMVLAAAVGCGGGEMQSESPVITLDGSSTVFPIAEAVAEEFQFVMPDARVTVGISGTGGGFEKLCTGETDISNASRPIKEVEIAACAEAGVEFIELPIAYDGIAVVTNPKNDWVNALTVDELKRIWEPDAQGTLVRWNQVKSEWPDEELHLFGPGADSGTFDYFTEIIVGESGASRGDFTSSEDDNVIVQGVSTDELALGFFGLAYYEENRDRLKIIGVNDENDDNGVGAITASAEVVRDGTYQPLSRPIFIYVSTAALNRPNTEAFIEFFLSDSVGLIREVGYVPLSDAEYGLVRDRVAARTTGSVFANASNVPLEMLLTPGS